MLEDITGKEIKEQFKSNKKLRLIVTVVGGLIVLTIGYFVYKQFIFNPSNEKSKEAYWPGLNYAVADSADLALDELRVHKNNYDGKVGGEVAQFVFARQLMAKGEFKKALAELEGVDLEDTYASIMAVGLQADCYSEMSKYEDAANLYMEAANMDENDMTTPMYLMKAGLCAEEVKDFTKATEIYEQIKSDYSAFASQKTIDKYITRAKNQSTGNK
ncbi:MAG: hypothetical protein JKY09_05965 [Crocinitomicaceae bacterium]|nr:hypothetical protein [Crocinitomicaceae bacterium]